MLGESFLQPYLYAAWMLFYVAHWRLLNFKTLNTGFAKTSVFLWIIWLFFLLMSCFFTHLVPLTLETLLDNMFIFCSYIFFLTLDKGKIKSAYLIFSVLIATLVVVAISILILFIPGWGSLLPGMNLLYASYGHNHQAALLLLVLPLAWWFAFEHKHWLLLLIPVLLSIGVLMSFGRVGVTLCFLQSVVIFLFTYSKGVKLNKLVFAVGVIIITTLFAKLILQSIFSIKTLIGVEYACPFPSFERQLCKSISEEPRQYYWEQAIESIREYPLTGYGPGTFSLINTKFRQVPQLRTLYTHNEYLQTFAESGVIAGMAFCALIIHGISVVVRGILRKENSKPVSVFYAVAIVAIAINNLFDFDWHFSAIYLLTWLIIALAIREKNNIVPIQLRESVLISIVKIKFLISFLCMLLVASIYLYTSLVIKSGNVARAFSIFPYFFNQQNIFQYSDQLSVEQRENFFLIYKHDPHSYEGRTLTKENATLLWEIDPWMFAEVFEPNSFNTQELENYMTLITKKIEYAQVHVGNSDYLLSTRMSNKIHQAAKSAFDSGNKMKAYELYHLAATLNPWSIHAYLLSEFPYYPEIEECTFAESMVPLASEAFGDQRESFAWLYMRCLAINFPDYPQAKRQIFLAKALELTPSIREYARDDIYRENTANFNISENLMADFDKFIEENQL